jgi:hypothetical protein
MEGVPAGERRLDMLFIQEGAIAASDWQLAILRVNSMLDLFCVEWGVKS